jgi:prepilin signal peptidase PulO-like enzyme (type II secretory pathway)
MKVKEIIYCCLMYGNLVFAAINMIIGINYHDCIASDIALWNLIVVIFMYQNKKEE